MQTTILTIAKHITVRPTEDKARRAEQERRDRISDDRTQIVAAAGAGKIEEMSALLQSTEYDPVEDRRFWANQENKQWKKSSGLRPGIYRRRRRMGLKSS